jgi:hypothetical protein
MDWSTSKDRTRGKEGVLYDIWTAIGNQTQATTLKGSHDGQIL